MAERLLNRALRQLLPPALARGWRWVRELLSERELECLTTWPLPGSGWAHPSVVEAQRAKWTQFLETVRGTGPLGIAHEAARIRSDDPFAHNAIISFGYALATVAHRNSLSVLDWGGGLGHYSLLAAALLPDVKLEYHVVELDDACRVGRELCPAVQFHTALSELGRRRFDFVMASGSLNCVRDWRTLLRELKDYTKERLLITRLPVIWSASSFVCLQRPRRHGYATEYAWWVLNRSEFLGEATSGSFKLVRELLLTDELRIWRAPEQPTYRGFLLRRQNDNGPPDSAA